MENLIKKIILPALFLSVCIEVSAQAKDETHPAYLDYTKSIEICVADLVSKMTLEEKVSQMMYNSPGIPLLNIPRYNWWNECLHGVARAGNATVFPQAIGLAATFDDNLISRIGTAISDEARAMYCKALKDIDAGHYRYYDQSDVKPRFPFVFGLSYTTFAYSNIKIEKSGNNIYNVSVDIKNTGNREGAEAVQLYVGQEKCSVPRPKKELKDFAKVTLKPGDFTIYVGASSADIKLKNTITL